MTERQEVTKMKNLLNTLAALATLAVSAPLGLAQSTLTATVPFAFGIGARQVLPAGTYVVYRAGDHWQFLSHETKIGAFVLGQPEQSKISDPSTLIFECRADRCALSRIQAGHGELGYSVPRPRLRRADALELARVVSVLLTRAEGN
jgi:hypothetical protein